MNCEILIRTVFPLLILLIHTSQTMADQNLALPADFAKKLAVFAVNMYSSIVLQKPIENIVISPFSIQTCAAMARVGAEKQTALELDQGLGLANYDLETMANTFYNILSTYEHSDVLKIANKIYVNEQFTLEPAFNEIIMKKFLSSAESINFNDKTAAAEKINAWAEEKTNHLIRDLVSANDLGDATRLVLINAIHFKGQWRKKFRADLTINDDFYLNENDKIQVPMMHIKDSFRHAHLPELEASVLEMPYKNSDLSMLVILPDSRTGLQSLEAKLKTIDINDIVKQMSFTQVLVTLPKFKTEFSMELSEPLSKLGISRMFTDDAEFGKMLQQQSDIKVSKVIHKAFIEVNEEGTEAAAATGFIVNRCCAPIAPELPEEFTADRPFYYGIFNQQRVPLFVGNIKKF